LHYVKQHFVHDSTNLRPVTLAQYDTGYRWPQLNISTVLVEWNSIKMPK